MTLRPVRQAVGTSSRPAALIPISDDDRRLPPRRLDVERELRLVLPCRPDEELLPFVFIASS